MVAADVEPLGRGRQRPALLGEMLSVADRVVAVVPDWKLLHLDCTRSDPACFQVNIRDDRRATI